MVRGGGKCHLRREAAGILSSSLPDVTSGSSSGATRRRKCAREEREEAGARPERTAEDARRRAPPGGSRPLLQGREGNWAGKRGGKGRAPELGFQRFAARLRVRVREERKRPGLTMTQLFGGGCLTRIKELCEQGY